MSDLRHVSHQDPFAGNTGMLRIIQNRSAESAKSYYSRSDYYGEGQDKSGVWHGRTARQLGLSGQIREEDFRALCDNLDPRDGSQLTARHNTDRTVGYDFNWHVPKSVSLAYAVGGDDRIADIFEQCVDETMREMEAEAATRVRLDGRHEDRTTGNLVWGSFLHTTTRPDDTGHPDPHLHSHCFVFNVTFDEQEGRFKAGQFRDLKRNAPYYEARMHARLAKRLKEELGYSIERHGRHWDISGLPEDLKQRFSRRTEEIESLAAAEGITDPEQKSDLGSQTRNTKSGVESFPELQRQWRGRLAENEWPLFKTLTDSDGGSVLSGPQTAAVVVELALRHCFERESVVPERTVLTEALRMGYGIVDVDEVQAEALRQGLITRDINGRRLSTLPQVLADEAAVLNFVRDGRHSVIPLNTAWSGPDSLLSTEQTDAIQQLINSDDRVQLLLGGAGVGKTTLMREAVAAIEEGGHDVFTFAPSAEASRGVLRNEGFSDATTVAELLVNAQLQQNLSGQVIWIDEASLLGSRQLKQVCDIAERMDCRLILSGDWKRQHGSVERGGVLGLIDRYTGVSPIQVNTIRRQQGAYRDAIAAMSEGRIADGFDQLDQLGWIHELSDDSRDARIAEDFSAALDRGRSALVVCPTHREAAHLTSSIREKLREAGRINGPDHEVSILKPLHLTSGERGHAALLHSGDVIIFTQNAKGYRKGTRLTVDENLPSDVFAQTDRFAVFRPKTMSLAAGDRIRITAGGRTRDGKHRLNTGSTFDVTNVLENGDIQLSNGWTIAADFGQIAAGWVSTSHASQGRTVDNVFVAESAESFAAASSEQFYVSASRGRKSCHLYTDSKDELRAAISESSRNITATEVFWPMNEQERHLRQQRAVTQAEPERIHEKELVHER
ncbi:MAG: MobF family relaxase [Planctomycetaceae bacterium]